MAPRARRAEASQLQLFHELGVRGRKTGVVLPDGGERDEHGMQPLDAIFSSPRSAAPANGGVLDDDDDDAESDDMDIPSSPGPGPQTLLKKQHNGQLPHLPHSRSPAKTNLNLAARRNPHLARRDGLDDGRNASVNRKLDFLGRQAGSSAVRAKPPGVNGSARAAGDEDSALSGYAADDVADSSEDSIRMVSAVRINDDDGSDDRQEAPHRSPEQGRAKRGAEGEDEDEDDEPSVATIKRRRVGRPRRKAKQRDGDEANPRPKTKWAARNSLGSPDAAVNGIPRSRPVDEAEEEPRQSKRQRTKAPGTSTATASPMETDNAGPGEVETDAVKAAKARTGKTPVVGRADKKDKQSGPRSRGRPHRVAEDRGVEAETSFAALQRGPPMPRSRGLVSMRRDGNAVTQTRSGRHSYRPLDYWRGEQVIRDDETQSDMFHKSDFVLPSIKGVVRVPDEAPRAKARAKANPAGRKRTQAYRQAAAYADEEPEAWELNPGTVTGEVVLWEPEHETQPPADDEPVQVTDERVAISADAIQTSEIKDASFRFAKTLTMPFMGSGVVDLPPGSEKRPKNSRKMHMVFFVHYGKVLVTINEAQFRISTGGTWFVPRGNYYSITNDYDHPSRIFFAQACEVQAQPTTDGASPPALSTPTAPKR